MPRSYYYLVAGFPDLTLDMARGAVTYRGALEEIHGIVDPGDAALLRALQFPYDNRNVIRLLEGKPWDFDDRGCFAEPELNEAVRTGEDLPDYLTVFLAARRESRALFPDATAEDALTWLYHDEMNDHGSEFVREWSDFDLGLRNVLAALNWRRLTAAGLMPAGSASLARCIVGRSDFADRILKSSAPDFGLGGQYRWVEQLLGLESLSPLEREMRIDLLRWNMLDDLTIISAFTIDTICAFTVKLALVERWRRLEAQAGRERLTNLTNRLVDQYRRAAEAA